MYQFSHVSQETLDNAWDDNVDFLRVPPDVSSIKLPARATSDSAGYDFFMPDDMTLYPGERYVIPTGIRAKIPHGSFLMLVPKSGLSFKYGTRLLNTVGIVDADYINSDNEGHILVGLTVDKKLELSEGQKFVQGIILPYLTLDDDNTTEVRNGGFGSTGA